MDNKTIIETAQGRLNAATYSPKRLALLHAGITAVVTLLCAIITHLLSGSMDTAVGLAGLNTRTALRFIQTALLLLVAVALPFWELGYTRAAILYAKGQTPQPPDLLYGFRRFFPALGLMLIRAFAVSVAAFMCLQLAVMLFAMSPWATEALTLLQQVGGPNNDAILLSLQNELVPVYGIWGILIILVILFLYYRFRLADIYLLEGANPIKALYESLRRTRYDWRQLVCLDFRFWLFYLGLGLCMGLSYLDLLLPYLGVRLNPEVAFWSFTVLGQIGNVALLTTFAPKAQTAYAIFAMEN